MVLHHAHRTALYQGLGEFVPEEAVDEMLSHFPTREGEEPVTKEFLRAELADVRTELRTGLADVRTEMVSLAHRQTRWMASTIVATAGVSIAVLRAFG